MNKIILKILTIISILIIVGGIFAGINVKNELTNEADFSEKVYIDGTDVSGANEIFVEMGSIFLGIAIIIYSFLLVGAIWLIYGIILLILKIVNKHNDKIERL